MRILHVTTELPPHFDGGLGTAVAGLVQVSTRAGLTSAVLLLDPHSHGAYEGSSSSYPGLGLIPYGYPYVHSDYSARTNNPRTFGYGSSTSDCLAYNIAGLLFQQPSLTDEEGGALMRAGLVRAPQSEDIDVLIRRASDWRPDIVHLHSVELWSVADAIRQESGASLVYTVHSLQLAEYEIGGALGGLELWPRQQKA